MKHLTVALITTRRPGRTEPNLRGLGPELMNSIRTFSRPTPLSLVERKCLIVTTLLAPLILILLVPP